MVSEQVQYYGDFFFFGNDAVVTFGISPSGVDAIFWLNI